MYWTPWARLMKSITPNTSVRPAAIRNSSTPSCRPFRVCTMRRERDIRASSSLPRQAGEGQESEASLHRAVFDVRIGIVGEDLLGDLGLVFAIGPLGNLHQIEVLDRIVVGVEPELAAQRGEVRLLHLLAQRILVVGPAARRL